MNNQNFINDFISKFQKNNSNQSKVFELLADQIRFYNIIIILMSLNKEKEQNMN
jgi:hypothetical protein